MAESDKATGNAADDRTTSVNVAVRIRPQSITERSAMNQICTRVASNEPQILLGKDLSFTYDYVFNMNSTQDMIFETLAKPLIDGCMDGYNATIIAYGQTGSGKTYTMGTAFDVDCSHLDAGIVPRSVQYLFSSVAKRRADAAAKHEPVPRFKVVAQFLELYNEELVDLLDSERIHKPHLRLHENAHGDIYLTGVSTRLVSDLDDTLKCLRDGSLVRSTASTNMNSQSSRSHAIFTLHIRQQRLLRYEEERNGSKKEIAGADTDPDSSAVDQVPEYETLTAKFHFVDLAGSERLKRTGATGDRAKEGISINRGLLALGNVISALGDKSKRGCHVPYRDSKLTRLLQDSLGGNSRTIMIACISPSDCDFVETLNTLKYANRARNIRNRVTMNQDKTSKQLATLRAQLAELQEELNTYRQGRQDVNQDGVSDLSNENLLLRSENDRLRLRVKALAVTIDSSKARNAQLLADHETMSWVMAKTRLIEANRELFLSAANKMQDSDGQTNNTGQNGLTPEMLGVVSADAEDFRHLVEKYTMEVEELRTKLAEAEALAEFTQRPYTHASPAQNKHNSSRPFSSLLNSSTKLDADYSSNRVAFTSTEFPDIDSSTISAAEAGLSALNMFVDGDSQDETNDLDYQHEHRGRCRNKIQTMNNRQVGLSNNEATKRTQSVNNVRSVAENNFIEFDDGDGDDSDDIGNDTLLADVSSTNCEKLNKIEPTSSDATDTDEDAELTTASADNDKPLNRSSTLGSQTAHLHKSLAHISSEIDSKQRLVAELQAKATQLEHMRLHYERQMNSLQSRIKETEHERDLMVESLGQIEHTGEEKLKQARMEFSKKLSALEDEVKKLQSTRQEQLKLERQQAKKNDELRELRHELEQLRRFKIDLAKRLREETQRVRQVEAASARKLLELRRAKSQADNQIRSLEAAHSAKDKALQRKQAELQALKKKNLEQQRQLSNSNTSRMTQSMIGTMGTAWTSNTTQPMQRSILRSSTKSNVQRTRTHTAKWSALLKEIEAAVQRRQTSLRLEHDLQTWIKERNSLGKRLQRLQRRRAHVEDAMLEDLEQDEFATKLSEYDEQIRNITAQLESAQDAIEECQSTILEISNTGPILNKTNSSQSNKSLTINSNSYNQTLTNSVQSLFTNCTLAEARFLLGQLFEDTVTRGLMAHRLQQTEAQLKASLSVHEQEREQELEMLKLAMQQAGIAADSLDTIFSMTTVNDHVARRRKTGHRANRIMHEFSSCECGSSTDAMSSAPVSSDNFTDMDEELGSSDDGADDNFAWSSDKIRSVTFARNQSTNKSRQLSYSMSKPSSSDLGDVTGCQLSNNEFEGVKTVKARRKMLQTEDMLGISTATSISQSVVADIMPPPSSTCLRRQRSTVHLTNTPLAQTPRSYLPASAGPSPACRRRVTNSSNVLNNDPVSSVGRNIPLNQQIVSGTMSTSLTLQNPDTETGYTSPISSPRKQLTDNEDVFDRLTSGIYNSPHLERGSIQPAQAKSIYCVSGISSIPDQSYHLPVSINPPCGPGTTLSTTNSLVTSQPLASFFTSNMSTSGGGGGGGGSSSNSATAPNNTNVLIANQACTSFTTPIECTHVAKGHTNAILDVDVLGNIMVTGSKDRTAKVWDLNTMEEIDTLKDHPNNVSKVRICPSTNLIFTVCSYFIKVWDTRSPRSCIRTLLSSGLSQDGEVETNVIRRHNICPAGETNILDLALGGSHGSLSHLMFLAVANSVKLWDLRRYYSVGKLHGNHQAPIMVLAAAENSALSSASDPKLTLVTGSKDHYIKVFNIGPNDCGLLTPTYDLVPPHYDGIESLVLNDNILFSGSRDAAIKKWNLAKNGRQEVLLAQAHKDWIQCLALNKGGTKLVSGCRAGSLKLWNASDCMCLGEVPNAHSGALNAVKVFDERIFTAGNDRDIRFWRFVDQSYNY